MRMELRLVALGWFVIRLHFIMAKMATAPREQSRDGMGWYGMVRGQVTVSGNLIPSSFMHIHKMMSRTQTRRTHFYKLRITTSVRVGIKGRERTGIWQGAYHTGGSIMRRIPASLAALHNVQPTQHDAMHFGFAFQLGLLYNCNMFRISQSALFLSLPSLSLSSVNC